LYCIQYFDRKLDFHHYYHHNHYLHLFIRK
jgi:hypothetical protein